MMLQTKLVCFVFFLTSVSGYGEEPEKIVLHEPECEFTAETNVTKNHHAGLNSVSSIKLTDSCEKGRVNWEYPREPEPGRPEGLTITASAGIKLCMRCVLQCEVNSDLKLHELKCYGPSSSPVNVKLVAPKMRRYKNHTLKPLRHEDKLLYMSAYVFALNPKGLPKGY